jgi:hypothetical protein
MRDEDDLWSLVRPLSQASYEEDTERSKVKRIERSGCCGRCAHLCGRLGSFQGLAQPDDVTLFSAVSRLRFSLLVFLTS